MSGVVTGAGGKVLAPRGIRSTADFSSYLLQAQQSKAKIIGMANAGGDLINLVKQAGEFGIVGGGRRSCGHRDVHFRYPQPRPQDCAGACSSPRGYYWDKDDLSREFGKNSSRA